MGRSRSLTLTDLLYLGTLSKPSIWAEPAAIVLKGTQVTLWCEGSLQATSFRLYKDGNSAPEEVKILKMPSNKTDFSFNFMNEFRAGLYWCSYYKSNIWSEPSEPLALVVTGVHDRPSLSAQSGPVVEAGGNVTLSCSSEKTVATFHLLKEGVADPPQQMKSKLSNGKNQAQFSVGPVNSSHGGTYRCYSSYNNNLQVWSQLSQPLHLEVTGAAEPRIPSQTKPGSDCASEPQNHRLENLIRMGLAALVLLVLAVLLWETQHSQRRIQVAAERDP